MDNGDTQIKPDDSSESIKPGKICDSLEIRDNLIRLLSNIYINPNSAEYVNINKYTFEKIKNTFNYMNKLLQYIISKVQLEKYQSIIDNEYVKFPCNISEMLSVVAVYNEAFDHIVEKLVLELVVDDNIHAFYSISVIESTLIDVVLDGDVDYIMLDADFNSFLEKLLTLSCHVLKIYPNFEKNVDGDIIEYIT
jgi:hypothetical protein